MHPEIQFFVDIAEKSVHSTCKCTSVFAHAGVFVTAYYVDNSVSPSNLPVVGLDGVVVTIQQLNDAVIQLPHHSMLDEGHEVIA